MPILDLVVYLLTDIPILAYVDILCYVIFIAIGFIYYHKWAAICKTGVKPGFVLGVAGGIGSLLFGAASFIFALQTIAIRHGIPWEILWSSFSGTFGFGVLDFAGALGITGAVVGKRMGGVMMVEGGLLALISILGIPILVPPGILMAVGGLWAYYDCINKPVLKRSEIVGFILLCIIVLGLILYASTYSPF